LLVLRVALARPVTDLIPERALVIGCFILLALFLVGNFLAVRLLAPSRRVAPAAGPLSFAACGSAGRINVIARLIRQ
jgi:hypothetical protein